MAFREDNMVKENMSKKNQIKKIMFQGTASSAGKSTIVAGLCRVLVNRGYRTVPYKSQNMSLNSFITLDGKEMGRAQVLQAECAKILPEAFMNPILLKPQGDSMSQVIYNGKVFKTMSAMEYEKYKPRFKEELKKDFDEFSKDFDVVCIEGAGSPAEINLRTNDIVNMGLAELVDSPVVLVGDIDKGGVFASLYGTVMLLSEEERKRIKGFVINKFRGDVEILKPGIKMIEEKLNMPCLGIVPYFRLNLEDEDGAVDLKKNVTNKIDVASIHLPHFSNFTDLLPLEMEEDVSVRYIERAEEFRNPDLLVIPGTKNTISDLKFLKNSGIFEKIKSYADKDGRIVGICGGYQMLLEKIYDPLKIEGEDEEMDGLGIFKGTTVMEDDKTMRQSSGMADFNGKEFSVYGYEIHMGKTEHGERPFIGSISSRDNISNSSDGAKTEDERVIGTYFHGIFDSINFREELLNNIRRDKNLPELKSKSFESEKEKEMEKLGKIIEESLDMDKIMEIING